MKGNPMRLTRTAPEEGESDRLSARILQWFGHYLRNEPAPAWITSGVSVLEREQELKRLEEGQLAECPVL
jgi:hypothetical protein